MHRLMPSFCLMVLILAVSGQTDKVGNRNGEWKMALLPLVGGKESSKPNGCLRIFSCTLSGVRRLKWLEQVRDVETAVFSYKNATRFRCLIITITAPTVTVRPEASTNSMLRW